MAPVTVSDLLAVSPAPGIALQVPSTAQEAPHQPLALGHTGHQLGGVRYWENTPAPHIPHHLLGTGDW